MTKTRTAACLGLVAASLLLSALPSASADEEEGIVIEPPRVTLHLSAVATVTVDCSNPAGSNSPPLSRGTYLAETTGECFYRNTQYCARDTTYVKEDCNGLREPAPHTLLVNNAPLLGGTGTGPFEHLGGSVNVKYRDSYYEDNSGLLQVKIYRII